MGKLENTIAGIDISPKATAVSVLEGKYFKSAFLIVAEGKHRSFKMPERFLSNIKIFFYKTLLDFYHIFEGIVNEVISENNIHPVIEGYAFGTRGRLTLTAEITGIVKLVLMQKGINFDIIPPSSVKKCIVKKGNARKSEVSVAMYKILKIDFSFLGEMMEDIYDASAVAYAWYKLHKSSNR